MRLLSMVALLGCVAAGQAATVLYDFETDADVQVWHDEGGTGLGGGKTLTRVERFAASGQSALRFTTPKWVPAEHGGTQVWPAFECAPAVSDWSSFDRLAFTAVNTTDATQLLAMFITDTTKPTREGLQWTRRLAPREGGQFVIDLAGLKARGLDPAHIGRIHIFTENPPVDLEILIDRMVLLAPGQALPPLPAGWYGAWAALYRGEVDALAAQVTRDGETLRGAARGVPALSAWVEQRLAAMAKRLPELRGALEQPGEASLRLPDQLAAARAELAAVADRLPVAKSFEPLRAKVQTDAAAAGVLVGFASPMVKVLPRAGKPDLRFEAATQMALARGESEALQVVIWPLSSNLKDVSIRVTGLGWPAGSVAAPPVGYVQTKSTPPYGSAHVGWWPDPILDFMDKADVAAGDAQSFWLRLKAPRNQKPGVSRGKLEVVSAGKVLFRFDLSVKVHSFEVPAATPLPSAITFAPHFYEDNGAGGWREGLYRDTAWESRKADWADFLADYGITYDSLYSYGGWKPEFDQLRRLHDQGRLGRFNLGYWSTCAPGKEDEYRQWMADVIRPRYEQAKALGILDHAYLYGCDELPEAEFPHVQRAAALLKAAFPEVFVLTTTYDHSFGQDTVIKSVDGFCPLTPKFDPKLAAQARAQGKQVWWYICCGPAHPYANMFIEYPAIEGRLLMGAMAAKYRPDGFLYYQISIWNGKPITSGPFTEWDPRSWTTYHGDGSWVCVGPNGRPLATQRLENFRDGLEDYAYTSVLEAAMARVKALPETAATGAWLGEAEARLVVPKDLVESMTRYTGDPAVVEAWRAGMAAAIEAAPPG
ncbi:MAG: DUF4091 domain-containing protein [Armatimonadetes bacterium]|nr:DUF4091 domain-containing protein [Armatimonadota bacterium]